MRWKQRASKPKRKPKVGDVRVKRWFAIFPVTIKGETRWLEKVTVKQVYLSENYRNELGELKTMYEWNNVEFRNQ